VPAVVRKTRHTNCAREERREKREERAEKREERREKREERREKRERSHLRVEGQ
jgi:hypothetical protein